MPGGPSLLPSPSALALRPTAESGAGVRRFRPPPAAPPQRAPSGRGAAALGAAPPPAGGSAVPRPVPPGSSRQPTSREGGERRRGGEGGESGGREAGRREKGSCLEPGLPRASQERALGGSPGPGRAPPSRTSLLLSGYPSPPPSSSCYARASGRPPAPLGHIPNSADSLPGRASSPHPFFLPAFPRARPPSPGLPSGSRLSPSPPRCAGASPCPVSPSHFLSRRPPLPRLQPAAPGEGRSGRARPRPAPRPSPARRGRTGKMNNGSKAEKENTPNEANLQEEEVRNGSVPGRGRPGTAAAGSAQSVGGWPAGRPAGRGSRGAGLRWGRGTEGLGIALAWRRSPRLRPRDEGVSSESVFWWVHARLRA